MNKTNSAPTRWRQYCLAKLHAFPSCFRAQARHLPDAQAHLAAALLAYADDLQEVCELLHAHARSTELIRGMREFPLSKDDRHFILNAIADRLRLLEQIPASPVPNLEQHELLLAQDAEFARLQILQDFFYDSS